MTTSLKDIRRFPEFWVAAAAFLLRLWFLQKFSQSVFFEPIANGNDRALYDRLAQQIAHGKWMPDGVFEYMPLYPWVLGLLYTFASANLWLAGFVGAIVDAVTAGMLVSFARRLKVRTWLAAAMGLVYAVYPVAIVYSVLTMPNTLNTFLFLLFAWSAYGLKRDDSLWKWLGTGLLCGVLSLGFAGILLVSMACLAYWIVEGIRARKFQPAGWLVFFLGAMLPIVPVSIHNWRAEHHFVLITAHGGFNFYMGNHDGATGYPVQIEGFRGDAGSLLVDARRAAEKEIGHAASSAEFAAFWSHRTKQFMREHPGAELKLIGLKILKFWNHYDYDDLRTVPMLRLTGTFFDWPFFALFDFAWIGWLGLIGIFLAQRVGILRWMTLAAIGGMIAFFITARYRLTVAPILCVMGVLALEQWLASSKHRMGKGIVVFIAGAIVFLPLGSSDFRALDHYNTAAYLMARDQPVEALKQAKAGLAIRPDASLFFVGGNACFALHDDVHAEEAFRNSLRLQPGNASAHYNLAQVLLRLGHTQEAVEELQRSVELDPDHSSARELLEKIRSVK